MKEKMPRQAMTLAEVMVFVALVSMAMLALVGVQIYAIRANAGSRERAIASTIAYSQLNEVLKEQREEYSKVADRPRQKVPDQPDFESAVSQIYYDASEDMKRVSCSVYWLDRNGAHEFSTWTFVYRGPP